ncbi:MAG: hypothetical protein Q9166_005714 [cf. Caloplaca sp. 2 TL-2023]
MFVKLATIVLVAAAAGLCLAVPTSEDMGLTIRESLAEPAPGDPTNYPDCGAPICVREAAPGSERPPKGCPKNYPDCGASIDKRAVENVGCNCPEGKVPFYFHGHCQCSDDALNYTRPDSSEHATEVCGCPEGTVGFKFRGVCQCSGESIPLSNNPHFRGKRSAISELGAGLSTEVRELDERKLCAQNCSYMQRARPHGEHGKCICEPYKREISTPEENNEQDEDNIAQVGEEKREVSSGLEERDAEINCQQRRKCPPGGHAQLVNHNCLCVPSKLRLERDAQDYPNPGPLDCTSIAKCPSGQHPTNNAADGMCECVDDDTPDSSILDCAAIAKCPANQHPVFNNMAGRCECIPDGTQLDCPSVSKCSDGAHPINYNGNCICVPDQQQKRDADASAAKESTVEKRFYDTWAIACRSSKKCPPHTHPDLVGRMCECKKD